MQASTATASSLRSAFLARSKVWIAGVVLRRAAMLLYKEFMPFLYPSSWSALNVSKALPSLGAMYAARLIDCRARRSFPNIFTSFRCPNAPKPLVRVAVVKQQFQFRVLQTVSKFARRARKGRIL